MTQVTQLRSRKHSCADATADSAVQLHRRKHRCSCVLKTVTSTPAIPAVAACPLDTFQEPPYDRSNAWWTSYLSNCVLYLVYIVISKLLSMWHMAGQHTVYLGVNKKIPKYILKVATSCMFLGTICRFQIIVMILVISYRNQHYSHESYQYIVIKTVCDQNWNSLWKNYLAKSRNATGEFFYSTLQMTNWRMPNGWIKQSLVPGRATISGNNTPNGNWLPFIHYATGYILGSIPVSLSCRDILARSIGYERCSTADLSKFPVCEMMTPVDFRTVTYVAKLCGALEVGEAEVEAVKQVWNVYRHDGFKAMTIHSQFKCISIY